MYVSNVYHHKKFGGSSKSIGEYVYSLKDKFDFEILCPYGSALNYFKQKKLKTIPIAGISGINITEIGCYKGLRLILLIREFYYFFLTYNLLKKIKNKNYDLIHLNDSNLIVIAPLLKKLFKKKIVCHIRTRLDTSNYFFKKIIKKIAKKYIHKFIKSFTISPGKSRQDCIFITPTHRQAFHLILMCKHVT